MLFVAGAHTDSKGVVGEEEDLQLIREEKCTTWKGKIYIESIEARVMLFVALH